MRRIKWKDVFKDSHKVSAYSIIEKKSNIQRGLGLQFCVSIINGTQLIIRACLELKRIA